jgi:hypothetical protein
VVFRGPITCNLTASYHVLEKYPASTYPTLEMEAVYSSKMQLTLYQSTRRNISDAKASRKNFVSRIIHVCIKNYVNPIQSRCIPYGFLMRNPFRFFFRFQKIANFNFTKTWSDLSSRSFYEHKQNANICTSDTLSSPFSALPRSTQRPPLRQD